MTEIIAENPQETSPSLAERLAKMRAEMDERAAQAGHVGLPPAERARSSRWSLHTRIDALIRAGDKRVRRDNRRGLRQHQEAPARRIRTHTQARIRARRSPASTRRATTDSGGDDAGGDPEPPRRPQSTSFSPVFGGGL